MTDQGPAGEAMSREGKGTAAAGEAGSSRPLRWEDVTRRLTKGGWFWLVTVRPDGAPHARPQCAQPLGHRLEVRPGERRHIVPRRLRQLRRPFDHPSCATDIAAPIRDVGRPGVATFHEVTRRTGQADPVWAGLAGDVT